MIETLKRWRRCIDWLDSADEAQLHRELERLYCDTRSQLNLLLATAALCERRQ